MANGAYCPTTLESNGFQTANVFVHRRLNSKLAVRGVHVDDLVRDVSDGTVLIHLLEILSQESLGRYAAKPKLRVQRFENANIALDYIKGRKIQLTNIGA